MATQKSVRNTPRAGVQRLVHRASQIPISSTLALAAALRVAVAAIPGIMLRDDATYYVDAAKHLAHGDGYLLRGAATAYWPVGYPAFLSLFMHGPGAALFLARLAQCALSVACIYMSYWIARRVYEEDGPARLTALILACMPNEIMYPSLLLGEVLFTFLVLAGCVLLLRPPHQALTLWAGLCFGGAVLVRPVVAILPALVVFLARYGSLRERITRVALVIAVMIGVTLPWAARNSVLFRQPVWVSTNGGVNAWIGIHGGATGGQQLAREMAFAGLLQGNEADADHRALERAIEIVRDHPGRAIVSAMRKAGRMWLPDHGGGDTVFPRTRSWQRKASAMVTDLYYLLLWTLVGWALLRRRRAAGLPAAVLVYFTVIYAAMVAMPRYQFPELPWLAMIAAGIVATPRAGERVPSSPNDLHGHRRG
jgi:hypothetical protein